MHTTVSTAEELDNKKNKVSQDRKLKLNKDRQNHNGKLSDTEGLKPIHMNGKRNYKVMIDDEEFDLTRIRNLSDVIADID